MEPGPRVPLDRPDAEILRWPEDAERVDDLRRQGRPRLLLLAPGGVPPEVSDEREDWAWTPIDERDLSSRLRRLAARRPLRGERDLETLHVDGDGVLHVEGRVLPLPPVEAALLHCLVREPAGGLRSRSELAAAAWGEGERSRRSLDSRVLTLRRRLAPLGLAVHAVSGRGFVLGSVDDGGSP